MNDNILKSFFAIILTFSLQLLAMGYCFGFDMNFSSDHLKNDTINNQIPKLDWQASTSIYFELGGKFIYSLNVDFRKKENFAFCIGACFWLDEEEHVQSIFIPSFMGFYLCGKRHRIELGGGCGPFIGTYIGMSNLMLFGNIGYRYQQKEGLIFRAGFTPWMAIPLTKNARFWSSPWAGISFGYSF